MNGLKDVGSLTADSASQVSPQLAGDAVNSLAMLGKTSLALLLVVATIWLCSFLLKRLNRQHLLGGKNLRIISSCAIGQRERVVVVAIEQTWLVLGVGGGQVNLLHQLDAPADAVHSADQGAESFASRLLRIRDRDSGN
ncbi:flagellar biosynthetic protein FliO [Porticoccus sp.]